MMEENQLKKQLKTKAIKINTDISKKKIKSLWMRKQEKPTVST